MIEVSNLEPSGNYTELQDTHVQTRSCDPQEDNSDELFELLNSSDDEAEPEEFVPMISHCKPPATQQPLVRGVRLIRNRVEFSRDQLAMKKDNFAHFMITDRMLKMKLGTSFSSFKYLDFQAIASEEPGLQSVIVVAHFERIYKGITL